SGLTGIAVALVLVAGAAPAAEESETPRPEAFVAATPSPSPASIIDEHRAKPQATPAAPAAPAERSPFDMHIYWERGLNYTVLQHVRLGTEEVFVFDKDATLSGRIGVKLGVDTAGYFESGDVPPVGTRFNLRRLLVYTTGEFRFLFPISFKFDLGGVG